MRDIAQIHENEKNYLDGCDCSILNLDKMHSLAMRVYSLYNMKHAWSRVDFDASLHVRDKILTSITGGMDAESLYQASLTIQPISPRSSPQSSPRSSPPSLRRSSSRELTCFAVQESNSRGTEHSILFSSTFVDEDSPFPNLPAH